MITHISYLDTIKALGWSVTPFNQWTDFTLKGFSCMIGLLIPVSFHKTSPSHANLGGGGEIWKSIIIFYHFLTVRETRCLKYVFWTTTWAQYKDGISRYEDFVGTSYVYNEISYNAKTASLYGDNPFTYIFDDMVAGDLATEGTRASAGGTELSRTIP